MGAACELTIKNKNCRALAFGWGTAGQFRSSARIVPTVNNASQRLRTSCKMPHGTPVSQRFFHQPMQYPHQAMPLFSSIHRAGPFNPALKKPLRTARRLSQHQDRYQCQQSCLFQPTAINPCVRVGNCYNNTRHAADKRINTWRRFSMMGAWFRVMTVAPSANAQP